MSKKTFIFISFVLILAMIGIFLLVHNSSGPKELDRIQNYTITVIPQDDGSLNMLYDISWKVLDSEKEGPVTWVEIGIPNRSVDSLKSLTNNIKNISFVGSSVKVEFGKNYQAGDIINFKFKFHQSDMYYVSNGNLKYEFTPGWFKDIAVDRITVKWRAGNIENTNAIDKQNGYYIWSSSLKKNEKMTAVIEYKSSAFNLPNNTKENGIGNITLSKFIPESSSKYIKTIGILFIVAIVCIVLGSLGSDDYGRHRGYGYGRSHYHSHSHSSFSSHSSCACAHSCACACACAGGGRAGCSKKDFYGTKLKSKDIIEKL